MDESVSCQITAAVVADPLPPSAIWGFTGLLAVIDTLVCQFAPNNFVDVCTAVLVAQDAITSPAESMARSGDDAPDDESAVDALQLPVRVFDEAFTVVPSNQMAVEFPFESITTLGNEAFVFDNVAIVPHAELTGLILAFTTPFSTQTATMSPFASMARQGLVALTPEVDRVVDGNAHWIGWLNKFVKPNNVLNMIVLLFIFILGLNIYCNHLALSSK
jgi:hypothetical protein